MNRKIEIKIESEMTGYGDDTKHSTRISVDGEASMRDLVIIIKGVCESIGELLGDELLFWESLNSEIFQRTVELLSKSFDEMDEKGDRANDGVCALRPSMSEEN